MDMIPLPQACRLARRSYAVLYQLALRGDVSAERRGARWYVSREECLRLAENPPPRRELPLPNFRARVVPATPSEDAA